LLPSCAPPDANLADDCGVDTAFSGASSGEGRIHPGWRNGRGCTRLAAFGEKLRCLNLEKLIEVKRAAGRPKDFDAIAELEAILEERAVAPE
jgi:hypothetical protein